MRGTGLEDVVRCVKDRKERLLAEGTYMHPTLIVVRDGDDDTCLMVEMSPGPKWWGGETSPVDVVLNYAAAAIAGLTADRACLTSDSYMFLRTGRSRAEIRRFWREYERAQSLSALWDAGRGEELGIAEALNLMVVERNRDPDTLAVFKTTSLPYKAEGDALTWLDEEDNVDDGFGPNVAEGTIPSALRDGFAAGSFEDMLLTVDASHIDPNEHPAVTRAHLDLATFRLLLGAGMALVPYLPSGPRSEYYQERTKRLVEELQPTAN